MNSSSSDLMSYCSLAKFFFLSFREAVGALFPCFFSVSLSKFWLSIACWKCYHLATFIPSTQSQFIILKHQVFKRRFTLCFLTAQVEPLSLLSHPFLNCPMFLMMKVFAINIILLVSGVCNVHLCQNFFSSSLCM